MAIRKKITRLFAIVAVAGLISTCGCATKTQTARLLMPTPLGLTLGVQHPGGDFHTACNCNTQEVPVFIASGRNLEQPESRLNPFGSERSLQPNLGIAYVTIGEGLTPEELHHETVSSQKRKKAKVEFKRIEMTQTPFKIDPWKVKQDADRHADHPWVKALRERLDHSSERSVCIFVHGYNTQFIDNTLLAAELYHYLGRHGAIISFEWPSESRLLGYIVDKGNATFSTRHFRGMIANLAKACDVDSITIVAHSAGAPIVVGALRELRLLEHDLPAEQVQQKYKVERVVLAAPDMDLQEFINGVYDRFYEVAKTVAVYASPKDRALGLSEKIYGNERLGRSVGKLEDWEQNVLGSVEEIEMIDASAAEQMFATFLGHNYFHRDPWISSDIGSFMLGCTPTRRGLVKPSGEIFWRFPTDYPQRLKQISKMPIFATFTDAFERMRSF